MIRPLLVGTHQYEWATNIFAYLFNKYWGTEPITYVSDRQVHPLYCNLEFMQVPCYTEGEWPWAHWFGHGLRSIFEHFAKDLIVLFLPDHWITRPVDKDAVIAMAVYMDAHPHLVRGDLTAGQAVYSYGHQIATSGGYGVWAVSPNHKHASLNGGITFPPSLWNPVEALDIIEDTWSLHDCEKLGTQKMQRQTALYSAAISPAPIHRAHVLHHAQQRVMNLTDVNPEDIPVIKECLPKDWGIIE